ncbi:hypothetical protein Pcaca04_28050 [Pectobacterium carotovorum subsp. carotovorum]|nr:hypothetical protein Pcaca04_28050 [Pectobacterium carotovorum subsp. carotovorum]
MSAFGTSNKKATRVNGTEIRISKEPKSEMLRLHPDTGKTTYTPRIRFIRLTKRR